MKIKFLALASLFSITTISSHATTVVGIDRNGKAIEECFLPEFAGNSDLALKQLMRLRGTKSGISVVGEVIFDNKSGSATFTASQVLMPNGVVADWKIMPLYLQTELVSMGTRRIRVGDHCAMTKPDILVKK